MAARVRSGIASVPVARSYWSFRRRSAQSLIATGAHRAGSPEGHPLGNCNIFGLRGGVSFIHSSRIAQISSLSASSIIVLCNSGTEFAAKRSRISAFVPRFQQGFLLMSSRILLTLGWPSLAFTRFATRGRSAVICRRFPEATRNPPA